MRRALWGLVLVLALVLAPATRALAAMPPYAVQVTRLFAPLAFQHADDVFGKSVDIDGDVMVVGSPDDNAHAGAVYAFRRVAGVWSDPMRIVPGDLAAGDRFGQSVAVDGDRIVVGSPYHDNGATVNVGAVYIYTWSGTAWTLENPHLLGANAEDILGVSVAIDSDSGGNPYIAAGSPGDDDKGAESGSVKVYGKVPGSIWSLQSTLLDTLGSAGDQLGQSVDIDASEMIIVAGAPFIDLDGDLNCGGVRTFGYSTGWHMDDNIYAPASERGTDDWFGWDVAISHRRLVVGAPMKDVGGVVDVGEAYTYIKPMDMWQYDRTMYNPNPSVGDSYGISVACEDRTVLVGAWYENGYIGTVYPYVLRYGAMTAWPSLTPTGAGVTHFGTSVALSQGTIVGGAQMSSSPDTAQCGAAYVFTSRATISGKVTDADTGVPLAGKEISVAPAGATDGDYEVPYLTFTDAAGNYSLNVDAGYYAVIAMDPTDTYYYAFYNGASTYETAQTLVVGANTNTPNINFGLYHKGTVYRFYNKKNGTHFYTDSVAERDHVIATWPTVFTYEGPAYYVKPSADTSPLYRFYNKISSSHFYTSSAEEAEHVKATWPNVFTYEGPTYRVSVAPGPGKSPVYRFYNKKNGSHFYTASGEEAEHVKAAWPDVYQYEGPAFWITP
jgi:hypothetical protein